MSRSGSNKSILLALFFAYGLTLIIPTLSRPAFVQVCEVRAVVLEKKEPPKPGAKGLTLKVRILESKTSGDSRADCRVPAPPEKEINVAIPDEDDLLLVKAGARVLLQYVSQSFSGAKGEESISWELLQVVK